MNYGAIKKTDIANGVGVRVTLFVSGCRNHCPGCFQPETWDFTYGRHFDEGTMQEILKAMEPSYITGFTMLGGEPFEPENQPKVCQILAEIRRAYPQKSLWSYTGYTLDKDMVPGGARYTEKTDEILSLLDVLVDGRFEEDKKDVGLMYRGSRNQRIIDMPQTIREGRIILWDQENAHK